MHQIWYDASTMHMEQAFVPKIVKLIIQEGRQAPFLIASDFLSAILISGRKLRRTKSVPTPFKSLAPKT